MHRKIFNTFFLKMGAVPCGCNFTSTDKIVIFKELIQSSHMLDTH